MEQDTKFFMKRTLSASIVRACPTCGASGLAEAGKAIEDKCPKCGTDRPVIEDLGEIWKKEV